MKSSCVTGWSRLAVGLAAIGVVVGATAATVDNAEARAKKRIHRPAQVTHRSIQPAATFTGASNYAAMVVDAKTGQVLYEKNANAIRFPASVTKVMTLYLVFEDLERGRFGLNSRIVMSPRCAAEAPSKLGMRPGATLDVEGGIKALVTKSANDVACAFAENLEGSVGAFSDRMTRKARALGMTNSVYRNASGLPNPYHVTTAQDLITLGRAIQDRFPRYYGYFGTRAYAYGGRVMPNHNKLLGRVQGVDGIKTGYTNASGFNLLTSVKSGGRSIVAVVMGGRSGPSRDAHMQQLIALNLPRASTGSRTAPLVAETGERGWTRTRVASASVPTPLASPLAAAAEPVAPIPAPAPAPIPVPVAAPVAASVVPVSSGVTPKAAPRQAETERAAAPAVAVVAAATTTPQTMRWVVGRQPTVTGSVAKAAEEASTQASRPAPVAVAARRAEPVEAAQARKGWLIQIGATTEPDSAKALLSDAQAKAGRALVAAEPFTEIFTKGETTYYRARFAGLNERSADEACKALKRSSVSCFAIKN